ncbi:ankyrin repeat-containing protein At5g02620-like [Miscanthus floridulus]|uniref:ankyrin repeat-containing protein At5g02620-like n=1 Tax=Miscanthus floridulus TaxID=154761 RepID=UPI003457671B
MCVETQVSTDEEAAEHEHEEAQTAASAPPRPTMSAACARVMGIQRCQRQELKQPEDGETPLFVAAEYGKTRLHSVARNGHVEVVHTLLEAEPSIALRTTRRARLCYTWPPRAHAISPGGGGNKQVCELKQQVSDIKNEVHSQLEQMRMRKQGITKHMRTNKLHEEGLNNAIN